MAKFYSRFRFPMILASGFAMTLGYTVLGPKWSSADHEVGLPPSANATANRSDQELLIRASHLLNDIAGKATPAVVSISTVKTLDAKEAAAESGAPFGLPPELFSTPGGGADGGAPTPGRKHHVIPKGHDEHMLALGSGIIIRPQGYILTNNHVVEHAERVTVTLDEKHKTTAHVVGTDPKTDLAVIKLDENPKSALPTIGFANSDQIKVGDWAIAIGSPFGLNQSVSFGIVSARGRSQMGILDIEDFIQTDAAINPGSSGGPLLNSSGEMIGVNTAIFSQSGGFIGIGFAIPAKIAHEVSDELIAKGRVERGWIGLMAQDLDPELASFFKTKSGQGALISDVQPGGPAGLASIRPGDVVLRYGNEPIDGATKLKNLVGKTRAGTEVPIELMRAGENQKITVLIREQPGSAFANHEMAGMAARDAKPAPKPTLGLTVDDIPPEIAHLLKLDSGSGAMVVSVQPGSAAFDAGLAPGDVILRANEQPIHDSHEFNQLSHRLLEKEAPAILYVQRGPQERIFVPVRPRA